MMKLMGLGQGVGWAWDSGSSLDLGSGVPSLKAEEGTCASVLPKSLPISPQHSKYEQYLPERLSCGIMAALCQVWESELSPLWADKRQSNGTE